MSQWKQQLKSLGETNPALRPHIKAVLASSEGHMSKKAGSGGSEDFIREVQGLLRLEGRQVYFKNESRLGGLSYADVDISFVNLPQGIGKAGGGAEAENNRMRFTVRGFDKSDPSLPPPPPEK